MFWATVCCRAVRCFMRAARPSKTCRAQSMYTMPSAGDAGGLKAEFGLRGQAEEVLEAEDLGLELLVLLHAVGVFRD